MQRSQIQCGFVNIISRKETATLACSSTSTGATLNDPWLMIMSTTLANLHDQHHAHQNCFRVIKTITDRVQPAQCSTIVFLIVKSGKSVSVFSLYWLQVVGYNRFDVQMLQSFIQLHKLTNHLIATFSVEKAQIIML